MDKSLKCCNCPKVFKLNSHLKRHELSCKGHQTYFTCSSCGDLLKSAKTLRIHKQKCSTNKVYFCDACDENFVNFSDLNIHKEGVHNKLECSICLKRITAKNMRRHIRKVHKNDTPATVCTIAPSVDNICSTNSHLFTTKYVPMLSAIVNGTLYNALVFSQNSKGPLAETIDFISFFWSHSHWYVFRCSLKEISLFKVNQAVLSLVVIDK